VVHPLDIEPDLRMVDSLSAIGVVQAVALLAALAGATAALRRRPWLGLGLLWFFVVLLPTNSLLPRLDLANDRQLYLASVGPFLALGVEVELLPRRWLRGVVAAAVAACAALTALRNLDYRSEVALWEQTASVSPAKPRVFNNLAVAYVAAGCTQQAEAAYREALRLDPGYALARENLALLESAALQPQASCSAGR
jgi:protein O-mannosyl-transferase